MAAGPSSTPSQQSLGGLKRGIKVGDAVASHAQQVLDDAICVSRPIGRRNHDDLASKRRD